MRTRRRSADQFSPRKLSKVSSLAFLNAPSSDCSIACSVTSPGVVMRLSCSRLNRSTIRWIRPVQSRSSSLEEVCPTLVRSWVEPTTPTKPEETTDFGTEIYTLLGGAPSEASTRSLRELFELELSERVSSPFSCRLDLARRDPPPPPPKLNRMPPPLIAAPMIPPNWALAGCVSMKLPSASKAAAQHVVFQQ
jgi:hypothetical protein